MKSVKNALWYPLMAGVFLCLALNGLAQAAATPVSGGTLEAINHVPLQGVYASTTSDQSSAYLVTTSAGQTGFLVIENGQSQFLETAIIGENLIVNSAANFIAAKGGTIYFSTVTRNQVFGSFQSSVSSYALTTAEKLEKIASLGQIVSVQTNGGTVQGAVTWVSTAIPVSDGVVLMLGVDNKLFLAEKNSTGFRALSTAIDQTTFAPLFSAMPQQRLSRVGSCFLFRANGPTWQLCPGDTQPQRITADPDGKTGNFILGENISVLGPTFGGSDGTTYKLAYSQNSASSADGPTRLAGWNPSSKTWTSLFRSEDGVSAWSGKFPRVASYSASGSLEVLGLRKDLAPISDRTGWMRPQALFVKDGGNWSPIAYIGQSLDGGTVQEISPAAAAGDCQAYLPMTVNGSVKIYRYQPSGCATQVTDPVITAVTSVTGDLKNDFAPGDFVTVYGKDLCGLISEPGTISPAAVSSTIPFPTRLGQCELLVNGFPAPLQFATTWAKDHSSQVNFLVPEGTPKGGAEITIRRLRPDQTVEGSSQQPWKIQVVDCEPRFFKANGRVILQNVSQGYTLVSKQNPARPGDWLTTYSAGWGLTTPLTKAGELPKAAATAMVWTEVWTWDGVSGGWSQATVYGNVVASPQFPGLYQLSFQIPANVTVDSENQTHIRVFHGTKNTFVDFSADVQK